MAISGLFNKKCSWRRRINIGRNTYGEMLYSEIVIGSEVSCARQVGPGNNMRQIRDKFPVGNINYKLVKYFMAPTDIQEGDIITYEGSDHRNVRDVRNAAGRDHHLEILAEEILGFGEMDQSNG